MLGYIYFELFLIVNLIAWANCSVRSASDEYPSAVAIVNTRRQFTSCSGVLINSRLVVTVSNCLVVNNGWKNLKVVAGLKKITARSFSTENVRDIRKAYQFPTLGSEISLIEVNEGFSVDASVKPVALPTKQKYPGVSCDLVGWKLSALDNPSTEKKVQTYVWNNCPKIFKNLSCFSFPVDDQKNCVGDMGSPIYCQGSFQGLLLGGACRAPGDILTYVSVYPYSAKLRAVSMKAGSMSTTQIRKSDLKYAMFSLIAGIFKANFKWSFIF